MAKYAINRTGVSQLRALAKGLTQASDDVIDRGKKLRSTINTEGNNLGKYESEMVDIVDEMDQKQKNATDAVETLSSNLSKVADRVEALLDKGIKGNK